MTTDKPSFSHHAPQGQNPGSMFAIVSVWLWEGPLANKLVTVNIYRSSATLDTGYIQAGETVGSYTAISPHWPTISGIGFSPEIAFVRLMDRLKHYVKLKDEIDQDDQKHWLGHG